MQFRTPISISKAESLLDYDSKIILLGSCFSENIGAKFEYYKFQNTVNPFGIIFNPVSIENIISRVIHLKYFTEEDIFFYNESWHCYEVHSELSYPDKETFLYQLNQLVEQSNHHITQSTHIIVTYGTSWVYRLNNSGNIVANCHKVPQKEFSKEILSVETIEQSIQNTIELIQSVNPNCQIIFTISPVRHIKDGFVENQRSKAHLITSIQKIINYQLSIINYFPSYEIMMDELRDYRFYAEDMLHLNQVAVDYIWELFKETNVSESIYGDMKEVENIQKGMAHKPFNSQSESHHKFLNDLNSKINRINNKYPFMIF